MLMDTVKKKLGYMVRSERERRGLSQAKLAEQAGVSTRTFRILKPVMAIRNLQL